MSDKLQTAEFSYEHYKYDISYDEPVSSCDISVTHINRCTMWKATIRKGDDIGLTELTPKGIFDIFKAQQYVLMHNKKSQLLDNVKITFPRDYGDDKAELCIDICVNVGFDVNTKINTSITLYPEDIHPETLNIILSEKHRKEIKKCKKMIVNHVDKRFDLIEKKIEQQCNWSCMIIMIFLLCLLLLFLHKK